MIHKASIRYTRALFQFASAQKGLEAVADDFESLERILRESKEFERFILSPSIPHHKRVEVLTSIFQKKFHPASFQFLLFLESKGRLNLLADISTQFQELYQQKLNILGVELVSAKPIDAGQVAEIKNRLSQKYKKEIRLSEKIEPGLIAGFQIKINDLIQDLSMFNQLQKLKSRILNA